MNALLFGFLTGICITNFAWGIAFKIRNKKEKSTEV